MLLDCEHFFDGYKANPALRARLRQGRLRRRRALGRAVRHQRRHAAARGRGRSSARCVKAIPGDHVGIHAHNDTEQAVANSLRRGARRRAADPGHAQWPRRALRQRQSRLHHPDAEAQAGVCRALRDRRLRRQRSTSSRTSRTRSTSCSTARQPPRALCRRERLRHQGRHPCLGHHEGPGDLRARRARARRQQAQAPGVRPGRPLERAGRARAHRHQVDKDDPRLSRLLDEVKEREAHRLRLRGGGRLVRAAGAAACSARCRDYFDVEQFDVNVEQRINANGERVTVRDGGGQGEGRRRDADLGRRRQRPGQRARPGAAQGPRQVPEIHRGARSSPTTACASSTAAPRR